MNIVQLNRLKKDKGMIISYDHAYIKLGEIYLQSKNYSMHNPSPFYVNKLGVAEFILKGLGSFDQNNLEALELYAQTYQMKKRAEEKLLSEGYITIPSLFKNTEDFKSLKIKEKPLSYYVVYKGKKPGIYTNWAECVAQVSKFSGNYYQKFPTLYEAEEAFKNFKDQ